MDMDRMVVSGKGLDPGSLHTLTLTFAEMLAEATEYDPFCGNSGTTNTTLCKDDATILHVRRATAITDPSDPACCEIEVEVVSSARAEYDAVFSAAERASATMAYPCRVTVLQFDELEDLMVK